ncbi:sugar-binding transcriptional regulator [Pectobacterium brasiliense]|nr:MULTISPECIES: sugar-binding transcriptional regulator [Pectobacterium]UKE82986.1 sugar-binding transcriptional regulator [Pectobacterium sp. PL152]KFF66038.1 transcriptional regulator [Pectobacterium brasiliense]KHS72037.1 transcriptional regulator [Pectobacterium brasiliense]MBA0196885.1 sugar-binding transcriptional regulator [Pectobacterium brasiliense]MBA0204792.1 sugar-binding transcriptional regulator [Pectobacterium aroidearum]
MSEFDSDSELLTEIAVAYYENQQTQEEIASRFGISRIKVGRLLKRARAEGIVEINVRYHPVFSSQLEQQFIKSFGIKRALIAIDHHDEDEQRQQVASLVSTYLSSILKNGMSVAVGQGRNVAAVASHVGVFPERHCKFICGIGGTQRDGELIDADHISRHLARKFNATSETLYAPAYVENSALKSSFMQNRLINDTLERASKADIALVGLGDMNENSFMVQLGWFTSQEIITARQDEGVVGDIAGYAFLDIQGRPVDTVMNDRVIGLSLDQLRKIPYVIAIASENTKATAILAALRSGIVDVIATSASNARTVLSLISAKH